MSRRLFYLFMILLLIIEVVQVLFIFNMLEWFKQQNVKTYPLLIFWMSLTALGVMTYFFIRGMWSIVKGKR